MIVSHDSKHHREPKLELRCTACGYGAVVRTPPATCPMCHGSVWDYISHEQLTGRAIQRVRGDSSSEVSGLLGGPDWYPIRDVALAAAASRQLDGLG